MLSIYRCRTYTNRNCVLECQSNHTLNLCECVPFYLPRNKNIKDCGKNKKYCVEEAKIDMETIQGKGSSCHCLPSCFSLQYTDHKSFAQLSSELNHNAGLPSISSKYYLKNMAVLQFFFHTSKFTKEIKSELYGFTEILSNIGGLLSLCLGFSFLSLVEMLYFLTLRVVCDMSQHTRKAIRKQNEIPFLK